MITNTWEPSLCLYSAVMRYIMRSLRSPDSFGRTLEAYLGYLPSVTVLVKTLLSSLAAERDLYWAKGDNEKHLPVWCCPCCGWSMWGHEMCPVQWWWPQGGTLLNSWGLPISVGGGLAFPACRHPGCPLPASKVKRWCVSWAVLWTMCELMKVSWAVLLSCLGPTG